MIILQLFVTAILIGLATLVIARKYADWNHHKFILVALGMWLTGVLLSLFGGVESVWLIVFLQSAVGWYLIARFLYVPPLRSFYVIIAYLGLRIFFAYAIGI